MNRKNKSPDLYETGKKLMEAFKKDKEVKSCPIYDTPTGTKYYIWQTEEDDNVRSSHSDRNGLIFDWDDPPEGGPLAKIIIADAQLSHII